MRKQQNRRGFDQYRPMEGSTRLKDLLARAQLRPGAKYIAFRCYDGYDVGIPLERGLLDGTILVL